MSEGYCICYAPSMPDHACPVHFPGKPEHFAPPVPGSSDRPVERAAEEGEKT